MGKWYGKVGYILTEQTEPGIWKSKSIEKNYYGDVLQYTSRWSKNSNVNDDLNVTNQISIVADPFAHENFHAIKYVEFMGVLWNVESVNVQRPRLILSLGGVYNGE